MVDQVCFPFPFKGLDVTLPGKNYIADGPADGAADGIGGEASGHAAGGLVHGGQVDLGEQRRLQKRQWQKTRCKIFPGTFLIGSG